jgi:hypothetical protein
MGGRRIILAETFKTPGKSAMGSCISAVGEKINIAIASKFCGNVKLTHVEVSDTIDIPKDRLFSLMSDYNNWPKLFPNSCTSVKLIRKEGDMEYIEMGDRRYGKVTEMHRVIPPDEIYIEEYTPNWTGIFVNLFESLPDGRTRLTLKVDIKGNNLLFRLIDPFSKSYVRNRVRNQIHEEIKASLKSITG